MQQVGQGWAGIDVGKTHHHVVLLDAEGAVLLSRRVANDEAELCSVIAAVLARASTVTWAVDLVDSPAALVIALLHASAQPLVHISGIAVNRATAGYRGEGKTDAKDAAVIADQARMRRDLRSLHVPQEGIVELQLLTSRRADLAADRVRAISRLRNRLLGVFPALERELDFTNQGPLVLVSLFQTPQAIIDAGAEEVERTLRARRVRPAHRLAAVAVVAAESQRTQLPGQAVAAPLIARLALDVLDLDQRIAEVDAQIAERFRAHPQAEVIASMTGIGDLLGAEFLAATGGDMSDFSSADHLAGYAGLAPAPRDSGRRAGNLHRPRRYNRQLQRVFYTSALISIQRCPASRAFYDRKRAEGKRHTQAVLALARRRVNVLWAMLRDGNTYREEPRPASLAA